MHVLLAAGWLSALVPCVAAASPWMKPPGHERTGGSSGRDTALPPPWPGPPGRERTARRLVIDEPGPRRFGGMVRRVGRIPWMVKEYGQPALQVRADGASVHGFAWRGSTEGVNVGSEPFDPHGMRRFHQPIRVVLEQLWCDDIGEDCLSIQPRARVTVRDSFFRGNHRLLPTEDDQVRGLDKIVQIDGAEVVMENCEFHHGASAVRGKANSRIVLKRCRFVNCSTCVSGDGLVNPRPGHPYDNGAPGRCVITLIECEAWDCALLARAYAGCEIRLVDCRVHHTRLRSEKGGTVRMYRQVEKGGQRFQHQNPACAWVWNRE